MKQLSLLHCKFALALAASIVIFGLCFLHANTAQAVIFSARGQWINSFEYGAGGNFTSRGRSQGGLKGQRVTGWGRYGQDEFGAKSRIRLQVNAAASEALSGSIYLEIGGHTWGQAKSGGALGADTSIIKLKHSYLDWAIPQTKIKLRMGLQRIFLPDFTTEASQVFDADVAGITATMPITDALTVSAFWARPYNDNTNANPQPAPNYLDNFDLFGLSAPLRLGGLNLTPWAILGASGNSTFQKGQDFYGKNASGSGALGLAPAVYALNTARVGRQTAAYATVGWAGLTGEVTAYAPFRLAASFNYGAVDTGLAALNRHGWYAALLAEYTLDLGTVGIYGWYASGDDADITNGSERMPSIESNNESTNGMASFGTLGTLTLGRDTLIGSTFVGTWGVGVRLRDLSFVENLTHILHVTMLGGTNSPGMAAYIKGAAQLHGHTLFTPDTGKGMADFNSANYYGLYLTEADRATEFGATTTWQVYDNFKILLEANYIALWLDQSRSVWGGFTTHNGRSVGANSIQDVWNVNMSFIYRF